MCNTLASFSREGKTSVADSMPLSGLLKTPGWRIKCGQFHVVAYNMYTIHILRMPVTYLWCRKY